MALTNVISVTSTATQASPISVPSTSETIAASAVGVNGCLLQVSNNSGGSITVTLADPGTTGIGNVGTTTAQTVGATTNRWFRISPGHVNQATGVANVAFSAITSVVYVIIPC